MVYSPRGPLAGQRAERETDFPILNLCIVMVRPRLGEWIVEPGSPRSRASRRCQRFLTVGRKLGIPHDTAGPVGPGDLLKHARGRGPSAAFENKPYRPASATVRQNRSSTGGLPAKRRRPPTDAKKQRPAA